ncbi:MAG: hypothetical protein ACTSVW_04970 [Candidatus Njordarchaeales archaeon]
MSVEIIEKDLYCPVCKKVTPHRIEKKNVGTPSFPIYRYKIICKVCGGRRYSPKMPEK